MSDSFDIELDHSGIRELLTSEAVMNICRTEAEKVKNRAGEGFELSEYVGPERVNVSVYASTWKAYHRALDDNALFKGL